MVRRSFAIAALALLVATPGCRFSLKGLKFWGRSGKARTSRRRDKKGEERGRRKRIAPFLEEEALKAIRQQLRFVA